MCAAQSAEIKMSHATHVGHVRSKPDCIFWDWPLWFVTFFRVSVEMHMTVRDVRVTRQPNGVIMKHSTRKSTLFKPIILPSQSETSSHCVKEGSVDISRSTWRPFCSKLGHVTRTSCDAHWFKVHLCDLNCICLSKCTYILAVVTYTKYTATYLHFCNVGICCIHLPLQAPISSSERAHFIVPLSQFSPQLINFSLATGKLTPVNYCISPWTLH